MATLPDFLSLAREDDPLREAFRDDVLAGLAQAARAVPARWLYDRAGLELHAQATRQPEYYLARAEEEILADRCAQMALAIGQGRALIEYGFGDPARSAIVAESIEPASRAVVGLSSGVLPALPESGGRPMLGFVPGSAIGAFGPGKAVDLLRGMRASLGDDGLLLIGLDLVKERTILTAAYDDAAGATAAFNLNLADRINRDLDGTIPVDSLRHRAIWNAELGRIELHLEATRDIAFAVSGKRFTLRAGDTVHTASHYKYDLRCATALLHSGGWEPVARYSDRRHRFMVFLARPEESRIVA